MRKAHSERALTLVEIMVVLVILGLIMSFVGGKIFGAGDKAKVKLTKLKMEEIRSSIEQYRLEYNAIPGQLDDLTRCNEQTGPGCAPLLNADGDSLMDAWGNRFDYRVSDGGRTFVIMSMGADGRRGGDGVDFDISLQGP